MSRDDVGEPLVRLIDDARRALMLDLERRLHAAGFDDHRPAFNSIFGYLREPEGTRITTLAERALITKQSMSELVREAAALGYAEIVPDPDDGRAKLVRFGARGVEAAKIVRQTFADWDARLSARVGPKKVKELRRMLLEVQEVVSPEAADR